jgi:hypothetical protein
MLTKQEANIDSTYDPDASFENYHSYSMVSNESPLPIHEEVIKEQISRMLQVRGYKQNAVNPDLIVFYSLFPGKTSLNTLRKHYGSYNKINYKPRISLSPTRTTLEGGVLVIQIIDARKSSPVWHAHISGLLAVPTSKQESYIQHKICSLFDKYDYFAHGFLVSRHKTRPSRKTVPILTLQRQGHAIK